MTEITERAQTELLRALFEIPDEHQLESGSAEELRSALEHTRQALTSFRMLAESTMAGLYFIYDGVFQYVNPAFVELFGYRSAEEIIGLQPMELVHSGDRAKVAEFIRRRVEGEVDSVRYSFRGLKADGGEILCEVLGRGVDFGGQTAIAGTVFDITEREQASRAVIQSEALFRGLSEQSPNMIVIVREGHIVYCNRTIELLTGYPAAKLSGGGFKFNDLVAPESQLRVAVHFDEHLRGDQGPPLEYQMRKQDGQTLQVSQTTRLIQHDDQLAVMAIITDVTERVAVERERERLLHDLQRRLQRETALKEATSVFASTLEVNQVLGHLAERLCAAANATSVYICSYDPDTQRSTTLADSYSAEASENERISDLGTEYALELEFPGTAEYIEGGEPFVTHLDDPDLGEPERRHMRKYGAQSTLIVPMQVAGKINAYAEIWESRRRREFSQDEIELCWAIAQQAAIAIGSGKLFEQANREIAERERAQEALRQSEQRYRAVAESANTGIAIADIDNRLTYVNPALAELLKYRVEDLEGVLLSELMDADQYAKVVEQTQLRIEGVRSQYELVLNRRDGEKRQVLISASPIVDAEGNYQAGIGIITDITELKSTQDALSVAIVRMEEALERARELAETEEALRDTISSLSGSLNLDEVLDRILENVGRVVPHDTADIMLLRGAGEDRGLTPVRGRGYRERGIEKWLLEQNLPWKEMQNFRRMERTGRPVAIPDTRNHPGWIELPETIWIRSYAGAPLRHMGRTIGFLNLSSELPGTYRQAHAESLQVFADQAAVAIENARLYSQAQDEIGERKRVERALRSSEQRYRSVFEGVRDAIIVQGLDGEIVEANQSAYALFGWSREQALGCSLEELIPEVKPLMRRAREDPGALPTAPVEFEAEGAGGRQFPVELRFQLYRLDEQEVVLVVARDITDRKLASEAERELVRMKVQFILSASHSLRTPLHTLMGFLELLTSGKVTDPARQADFLARASDDAARIYSLISDLMDAARIEVGEQGLQLEVLRAGDLIDRAVVARRSEAVQAGIELLQAESSAAVVLQADARRLGAALDAVLHNAIRYSPSGSQVSIQAERVRDEAVLTVRDQGPGIAAADLRALLGGSELGGTSPLKASSGPGLGLYMANSVVHAHGGRLEIDSQVGQGTTVRMRLPAP